MKPKQQVQNRSANITTTKAWQQEFNQAPNAMPSKLEPWHRELRETCIEEAHMDPNTSPDVTRSYLASYLRETYGSVARIKDWGRSARLGR